MSTPEGLCTKCSATQYCDEHEPGAPAPAAPELRDTPCVPSPSIRDWCLAHSGYCYRDSRGAPAPAQGEPACTCQTDTKAGRYRRKRERHASWCPAFASPPPTLEQRLAALEAENARLRKRAEQAERTISAMADAIGGKPAKDTDDSYPNVSEAVALKRQRDQLEAERDGQRQARETVQLAQDITNRERNELRAQLDAALARATAAEAERDEARFRPLGDNHHNAAACPHCRPALEQERAELAAARAALADAQRVAFMAGYGAGANDQAHFNGGYLNSPDAFAAWQAQQPAPRGGQEHTNG